MLGKVQVSHTKRTCCRYVMKERGRRKIWCSFLNNVSLKLCDEEFDSIVDESDEEIELEEDDEGWKEEAVEVVRRAGAGVVENVEAVEVGQGGDMFQVVEGVRTVSGRVVEASEREHESRENESQARAVRMRGGEVGSDLEVFCASSFVVHGVDDLCCSVGCVVCEESGGKYGVA